MGQCHSKADVLALHALMSEITKTRALHEALRWHIDENHKAHIRRLEMALEACVVDESRLANKTSAERMDIQAVFDQAQQRLDARRAR
jgi:hypothetical protein